MPASTLYAGLVFALFGSNVQGTDQSTHHFSPWPDSRSDFRPDSQLNSRHLAFYSDLCAALSSTVHYPNVSSFRHSFAMQITLNIFNPQAGAQDILLNLDIFPDMVLETLRQSVHAETNIPATSLHIYHNGRLLTDDTKTMEQLEIPDGGMLAVHVRPIRGNTGVAQPSAAASSSASASAQAQSSHQSRPQASGANDPELIRLQILGNPAVRQQLQRQHPGLAAAVDDPVRFSQILQSSQERDRRDREERQREIQRLNQDPFNIENQRKIEDMIRQERVMENLQSAMEHNPEVFGRVHLLYIDVEVNGHKVKALVDSGAQATIMSPAYAEACGIMRLIDTRFAGVARGVGTAKILGRVHSAQIKVGNLFLPCSFTVMEGKTTHLLLGLDMLKRYQATIDLSRDRLIIQGEEIPFLGEANIPKDEEPVEQEATIPGPAGTTIGQETGAVLPPRPAPPQSAAQARTTAASSQASANAPSLSNPSTSTQAPSSTPVAAGSAAAVNVSSAHVESLIAMGATREQAVQALQAAEDNVEHTVVAGRNSMQEKSLWLQSSPMGQNNNG
ncbi:DNA damage-inducible protein 1 [Claviceps digitariae]|nr:DNA damage-inducible protein 1 [Claviceps digitariae]